MISIVTAIYNQRPMNELYFEYLKKFTKYKFELIIVDNGSTDGSAEYFEEKGVVVIRNDGNYSYPYCQNRGIENANYDIIAFLNNDLIVPKGWDERLLHEMAKGEYEIVSFATNDRMETQKITKKQLRRWRRIKYPVSFLFGTGKKSLRAMHYMMYGNWDTWSEQRQKQFKNQTIEGYSGSCIAFKKSVIDKIGLWDERVQAADADIFLRSRKRAHEKGDMKSIHILLDIYMHHFQRLTLKSNYPEFKDKENILRIHEKWSEADLNEILDGFSYK